MINLNDEINTNRFSISLDGDEYLTIMRALYWYQDKLTNQERAKGRDDREWDIVAYLRQQLADTLKKDTFI
jgi:hypothetical protein